MKRSVMRNITQRLVRPRQYWEDRAQALGDKGGWFVGRTDMYSYLDGGYAHSAYPPDNGERVQFRGSPVSALRRAVRYAERANESRSGAR